MKKSLPATDGFTLVELAMTLVIIGLLVGGVLKGQELISNARIKKTVTAIDSYRSASNIFQDTYGSLPGDLNNPATSLPGCATIATCEPAGGDENGAIGTPRIVDWANNDQSAPTTEATQFWIQLSAASLLDGISNDNTTDWGALYPASPLGGGFQIVNVASGAIHQVSGNYFVLREPPTGSPTPQAGNATVMTPAILAKLDRKYDDGRPNTGTIIADDADDRCWKKSTREYNEDSGEKICLAAFRM